MNSRQVYGRPLKANTNGAPQPAKHLAGIHGSILRQCWPILHTSNGNNLKQDYYTSNTLQPTAPFLS